MRDVETEARAWAASDPDDADRAELERLLADTGDDARRELADRFAGRLVFGTAGLRGAIGAGPNRMNRAVVRATTAAVARWLLEHRAGAAAAGVVIGCDARHRSAELADEATGVLAGARLVVHRLPDRSPTPVLAYAVRHLGAAAGVMITASHNPATDNGYKLYLGDGAQIVPPIDAEIEALVASVGPITRIPVAALPSRLVQRHGDEVRDAYLRAVLSAVPPARRPPEPLSVVYTPLHGVAGGVLLEAFRLAGYPSPTVVASQAQPDPDFPTAPFPNPEEPGALDRAVHEARRAGADLVLANDPDGDRLAVAILDASYDGGWRRLSGDELGVLLGSFVLEHVLEHLDDAAASGRTTAPHPRSHAPGRPLVATSIVSSAMLEKVAGAAHASFVATLTGFKWIVRSVDAVPGSRFVFGYEEALGYAIGDVVRDKDGIGASLCVMALAGELRARGSSLAERLDDLAVTFGLHQTAQHSIPSRDPGALMTRLRAAMPADIAGRRVVRTLDLAGGAVWQEGLPPLPPADVLGFWLSSGARVLVRPSGTEPKLKCYVEVVREVGDGDLHRARGEAAAELAALESALATMLAG